MLVPRVSLSFASSEQRRKMFLSGLLGSRNQETVDSVPIWDWELNDCLATRSLRDYASTALWPSIRIRYRADRPVGLA
jgi:hypothetical protein